MSEFKEPREILPDDEYSHLDEELVELYDFDLELDEEELNEQESDEASIVANYDKYIDMAQLNQDVAAGNISSYSPAQILRVLTKTARTTSTGQTVIDYELEINGVSGAKTYEVRMLPQ